MKYLSLLLSFAGSLSLLAETGRPNIVFLFSDDHAINAISAYPGGPFDEIAPTPNIDRIAQEGLLFENSFCTNSICGPSRASILTGKHSHQNGFLSNTSSYFDGLQQTFPQLLRDEGYHTAMIGKWHLHSNPIGFDHWEILPGQGAYYNPDLIQMDDSRKRYEGHCNDIVTQLGIEHLKKLSAEEGKPFMAMIQYKAPHRNWMAAPRHLTLFDEVTMPEPASLFDDYANRSSALAEHAMGIHQHMSWGGDMKFHGENPYPDHFTDTPNRSYNRMTPAQQEAWDAAYEPKNQKFIADMEAGTMTTEDIVRWKYQRYVKDYLRSIRSMDEGIGNILNFLDHSGLSKNTIVIYASDQGFYLGEHGWYDKRWMFEESFRMPFLIRWPEVIKPGSVSQELIQNIDYAPTFLELCGAEVPNDIQGRSLVPLFKNSGAAPDDWRDSLYYRYYGEPTHSVAAHDGVRTKTRKLLYLPKTDEYQLFDLEEDPSEMRSLHEDPAYAEVFEELKAKLDQLRRHYRMHSAILPTDRNDQENWKVRQKEKNRRAKQQSHDLLFIGDSITQSWESTGAKVWEKYYAHRNALNLGFSGDRTEHVLWRLNNGNLRGQEKAKLAVLLVGTNNSGHRKQDPYETAEGIEMILSTLRARCPDAKVLLLGVFPRGEKATSTGRLLNLSINKQISRLADGERVHYLDLSERFLGEHGTLPTSLMPDFLHLSEKGYQIWAEAIEAKIVELGL